MFAKSVLILFSAREVTSLDYKHQIDYHFNNAIRGFRQAPAFAANHEPVDIVIPIYNSYDYVKGCIESVLRNSESPYYLYLINDCSTDKRIEPYLDELERSALSEHLIRLAVIHSDRNLGFIKTVNLGMSQSDHHVILLNSDTIVPENWIGRLLNPIVQDDDIASVSPFSNNAWICSFPTWEEEHPLPEHLSVQEVDDIIGRFGSNEPIELPTTIGFCMALNRSVIQRIGLFDDEHYGKGYCEEGDWCFRAKTAGYRNVLTPNLYVYHKLGASFDTRTDGSRDERIEENLVKWSARYPELFAGIQVFLDEDPILPIRTVLRSAVEARNRADKEGVLLIDPNMDHERYPVFLPKEAGKRIYGLRLDSDGLRITDPNIEDGITFTISPEGFEKAELESLLEMLCIHSISYSPL
jgi:GT2 family glycosyltransferase